MHPFPHFYAASADATILGPVPIVSEGLPPLATTVPPEFDGPGGHWSPETLLVAAVVDCFVLTFRGIARASQFPWYSISCHVTGTLERVAQVTQFTHFSIHAIVQVPIGASITEARRLLARAEQTCLITNSMKATVELNADVETVAQRSA